MADKNNKKEVPTPAAQGRDPDSRVGKKINGMDIKKARKIVLDTIGEKEGPGEKKEKINIKLVPGGLKRGVESDIGADSSRWVDRLKSQKTKPKKFLSFTYGPKQKSREVKETDERKEQKKEIMQKEGENVSKFQQTPQKSEKKKQQGKQSKLKSKTVKKKKIKEKINIKAVEERKLEFNKILNQIKSSGKISFYMILLFTLLFMIFYLTFALILINFNLDNKLTRKISSYLPVPAIISNIGIIEYYDYRDVLKQGIDNLSAKQELIKRLIIKNSVDKNIKVENFDEFADEEIKKLKVWSFVD
jgi:hypothetical protein